MDDLRRQPVSVGVADAVTTNHLLRSPGRILFYYALVIVAWVGAWLLFRATSVGGMSPGVQFVYWTAAKLLIWIFPVVVISIASSSDAPPIAAALGFRSVPAGVRTGVILGLALVALSLILDVFTKHFRLPAASFALLNVLVIAPVFEETLFRGFVLPQLEASGVPFWPANALTAVMFLGLHVPGWYFAGILRPAQGVVAFGIVLVGLVAGYAKRASGSTWGSVSVHFVNNLYQSFLTAS